MNSHPVVSQEISALTFSPNGAYLASAAKDGSVLIWSTQDRRIVSRCAQSSADAERTRLISITHAVPPTPTASSPASPSTPPLKPTFSLTSTSPANSPAGKIPSLPTSQAPQFFPAAAVSALRLPPFLGRVPEARRRLRASLAESSTMRDGWRMMTT